MLASYPGLLSLHSICVILGRKKSRNMRHNAFSPCLQSELERNRCYVYNRLKTENKFIALLKILFKLYGASHIILDYLQSLAPKNAHNTRKIYYFLQKKIPIVLLNCSKWFFLLKFLICPSNRNLDPLTRSNLLWDTLYLKNKCLPAKCQVFMPTYYSPMR